MGDIEIVTDAGTITLTGVWHLPDIGGNLLSVSRIIDAGYTVEFGPTLCIVSKDNIRTNLGYRVGSLYYLRKEEPVAVAHLGLSTNQSPIATMDIWHRRLCHRTLDETAIRYIASKVQNLEIQNAGKPTTRICGT